MKSEKSAAVKAWKVQENREYPAQQGIFKHNLSTTKTAKIYVSLFFGPLLALFVHENQKMVKNMTCL